ncbi:MAG: enoyl-CoA hydratase/isomerase family protein [Phycisphaerales bacterium]|nr:enoyl-CoA hydratase/isomerase family protein [Phycisphaerales bacterium]
MPDAMMMDFPKPRPAGEFTFTTIGYEKGERRATITLNRPEVLNAVNFTMLRELRDAIEDVSWDDDVRVLVVTGAGDRAFCTGADLKEQNDHCLNDPDAYWKWMGAFIEMHEKLRTIGKPTVARLNGIVVGGGNEIHMSCDLAVAADDIHIRQVGAARGSVAAAGATQWLPLIVGDRRAREILMLCEPIPAAKALEWGLVNQVVPRTQLDSAVDVLCAKLIDKLPECMRYTKQQLNYWRETSWHQTIGHAREWLSIHNLAPEVHEGIQAFVEKRPIDHSRYRRGGGSDG